MSLHNDIVSEVIQDDIKITTYKDGSQHFQPIDKSKQLIETDNRSWWKKLKDWWNDTPIKPYVKIRDLADPIGKRKKDPFDYDVGSDGKSAVEIGIKISF